MRKENAKRIAEEYLSGERLWFKQGSFHENQGFTVFPIKKDELDLYELEGRISKVLEHCGEAFIECNKEYCTNKEAAKEILSFCEFNKEQNHKR